MIYCRISKDRIGAHLGVDRQEFECREMARKRGWTVVAVFADNDLSAYSGKPRPGYRRLLALIEAGEADAVLCWHTDRLHRHGDPMELENYIDLCQPRNIPTYAKQAGTLDLTTAWGRKDARNRAVDARYESEHASERLVEKMTELARDGLFLGGPRPFGFDSDGLTPRPAEIAAIARAIQDVLAGASIGSVARAWNELGLKPPQGAKEWIPASVRSVLMRPRNAGLSVHRRQVVGNATWAPIVSEAQWRALKSMLDDPERRPKGNLSLKWQGSNGYYCGKCDGKATMRSNSVWSPKRKILQPAYRCRAVNHNTIIAEPVDDLVNAVIADLLRRENVSLLPSADPDELRSAQAELTALGNRKKQLAALYGANEIDEQEWSEARASLTGALERAQAKVAELSAGSTLAGIADAPDPGRAFLASTVERRRAVITAVAVVSIMPNNPKGYTREAGKIDPNRVDITPIG
ncbi:hypothetical protein YIM_48660 (plasmid) [Amycolatopsis sp. YIM 10]|nr:hypothetical protein YIM_13220 [Amycolatopsis sp. YIM 10]QFU94857.1 hypothetical protein YIM_48660 [Amycolatopsis sp. YIM 10]